MSDILMFDVATFDICILHSKCTWFTIMLEYGPECNIIITKRKLIKKSTICNICLMVIAILFRWWIGADQRAYIGQPKVMDYTHLNTLISLEL